jgi:GNAT superfamily N-acetyltransferase
MIEIKKAQNKKDLTQFIDFPHDLYADDPNYVPELFMAMEELMDKKKFPFFKHSEADFFLAYRDDKIVGRICAIKNNHHNEYTGQSAGHFGFFDVIDDYEVAEKLLDTAKSWIKEKGLIDMLGPANYSTNETCALLVEGFDSPPTIMMPYNKPYYGQFLENYGFEKDMDLLSYTLSADDYPEKLKRLTPMLLERLNNKGITIRKINLKAFKQDVEQIFEIYNAAWEKNWGFVPMTKEEFLFAAKDMKQIVDRDYVLIAEHNGSPIGFSLSIPDLNVALKHVKRGRLLPFGIFKLLYYKRKVERMRVITLGVVKEYRKLGIDSYFYAKAYEENLRKGIPYGEASWVLENNVLMNRALENIKAKVYKRHRLYKKAI